MKRKRGRSSIEWLGVVIFAFAQTIPVLWVLAALLFGLWAREVFGEVELWWRIQ